ncbi:MAG: DegT/DnrJ/EryC1/StrS aminotransferase family protein [Lentisphaerota bacterium]
MIPHSRPVAEEDGIQAVVAALRAGHLAQGEEVARLEEDLSAFFPGRHVVVVSSGTAALYLALVAHGIGPRGRVVIPSYACNSLYAAVSYTGAAPLCADSGEDSVNITPETVGAAGECDAVIVPHTFGYLADIGHFMAAGRVVIEDCAQAFGKGPDGIWLGNAGDAAVLSFYATKLLPAGEGGACVLRRPEQADLIRRLRNADEQQPHPRAFNFKMSDLCAALARAQLKKLERDLQAREHLALRYDEAFGSSSHRVKTGQRQAVCFRYLIRAGPRAIDFMARAESRGIRCRPAIWRPLHLTLGGSCPHAETLAQSLLSVPFYPGLAGEEVEKICGTLPELLRAG